MPNYANGKIYTIRSHQTDEIYIGSTTQALSVRFGEHKKKYKYWKAGKEKYKITSGEIIKHGDAYIELLETCVCTNKDELHKREGELIRANVCVNKVIPGRTQKEYYNDNREMFLIKQMKYNENNKETIAVRQKKYRKDNNDKIKAHKGKKIMCDYCNTNFTHGHKTRHIKSTRHIKNYKAEYLKCFGEPFTDVITSQDY
jgi:hypothetical protein